MPKRLEPLPEVTMQIKLGSNGPNRSKPTSRFLLDFIVVNSDPREIKINPFLFYLHIHEQFRRTGHSSCSMATSHGALV